jgi:uncharacterized membrane protein YgcG
VIWVYVIVFALAGAFFWGLRRLGRRLAPPAAGTADAGGGDSPLADNAEFLAQAAERVLRRRGGSDSVSEGGGSDGGGGDGGGGDGG